jgi:TRAP-type C4-dicarboxylate transport system permease small subunit
MKPTWRRWLDRWRLPVASFCGIVAGIFLIAMMLLTIADVVLRGLLNIPVRGTYELVELLLAYTFFVAVPAVLLRDENIVVNVVDGIAGGFVPVLKRLGHAGAVVVFAVMAWCTWRAAADALVFDDVTADLGLSRRLHWTAVLIGLSGATIASLVMCLRTDDRQ